MITGFGEQSANYGAAVGQSLAQLGQQVGQQLAMREYQKQAQAALPALQQTYTSAMDKIQAGQVTEGYRDILNAQLQFGASQNPFIARMNDMAGGIAEQAANNYLKMKQYEIQYGPRPSTTTPGLPVMSGADVVRQRAGRGVVSQPDTVTTGGAEEESRRIGNAVLLPGESPIDGETPIEEVTSPSGEPLTGEGTPLTPLDVATRDTALSFNQRPPEEKVAYNQQVLSLNPPEKGYKQEKVKGLSKYYGTDELFLPELGTRIQQTYSISGSSTSPETTERLTEEEVIINKEEYDKAIAIKNDVSKAVAYLSKNRPVNSKKTFEKIIQEGGGPEYFNLSKNDGAVEDVERFPGVLVNTQTEEQFFLTEEEAKDIGLLIALPTMVDSRGIRFGEGAKPTSSPAAPAAGGSVAERVRAQYGAKETGATPPSAPTPTPGPTPIPFGEQYATPEERERAMTERIRGGIGAGLRAVGRGGEAILRGARAIR